MVKRIRALILLVILALAVGTGAYVAWRLKHPGFRAASTPVINEQTLIDGNITVDGEYFIQFTVLPGAFDIRVSGNFSVIGEGTITVIVVNGTNFVSGFDLPTSYDSGQQTAGHVDATLTPDATYYLVYVTFEQVGYPQPVKIVDTDVNLNYLYN
ncbi:MAG TPA: hypothetical protein VK536_01555 [Candidatus Limnocylindrales bacterium]|nr:hypothetical protein [Candidatus Limnocylindrales bacterium]